MIRFRRSLPEMTERYERHTERAALETLAFDSRPKEIARAHATLRSNMRTLARRQGRSLGMTLPGWVRHELGWEPGTRLILLPTADGSLEMRAATDADALPLARAALQRADLLRAQGLPRRQLEHFEKHCRQCGDLYCARNRRQLFCVACARDRKRARERARWRERGNFLRSLGAHRKRGAVGEPELISIQA